MEELLAKHGVDLWEQYSELLETLKVKSPRHAMEAVLKMFEYVRPKLSSQDVTVTAEVGPTRLAVERELLNHMLTNPEALSALRALEAAAPMLSGPPAERPPANVIPSPDVNNANDVPERACNTHAGTDIAGGDDESTTEND